MSYVVYYWINATPTSRNFCTRSDANIFASWLRSEGVEDRDILVKAYDGNVPTKIKRG